MTTFSWILGAFAVHCFVGWYWFRAGYACGERHTQDRWRQSLLVTPGRVNVPTGTTGWPPVLAEVSRLNAAAAARTAGYTVLPCGCLDVCTNYRDHGADLRDFVAPAYRATPKLVVSSKTAADMKRSGLEFKFKQELMGDTPFARPAVTGFAGFGDKPCAGLDSDVVEATPCRLKAGHVGPCLG